MNSPGLGTDHSRSRRSDGRVAARYRRAKATKRGGTEDQESEHLVVPRKRGNAPVRTPGREGGAGAWTRWRDR